MSEPTTPSSVPARAITAAWGVIDDQLGRRVVAHPWYALDAEGRILAAHTGAPAGEDRPTIVEDLGPSLVVPGLVNAHSHAFQRGIRGCTHRRGADDPSSFWSWREAMYRAANDLDPDGFELATRRCFEEMLANGITCVGEFHYVHHQPGGTPYDDPNELSRRVIAAARAVGLRLTLLEVFYARSGPGGAPLPEQRRFCDADVDAYLRRVETLVAETRDDPRVCVGLAPHSVRAVGAADLRALAEAAARWNLPLHAHVSEQPAENEACQVEHGKSPTQVFADAGCLDRARTFTAVHGIFIDETDRRLLGEQHVCACPTTEADLGDGIVPASELLRAGAEIALGSDSNAVVDLVQEARLLEMHERIVHGARLRLADEDGLLAPRLLRAGTVGGASALGWDRRGNTRPALGRLCLGAPFDAVAVDLRHRALRDVPGAHALDALMLSATASVVHEVFIDGARRR